MTLVGTRLDTCVVDCKKFMAFVRLLKMISRFGLPFTALGLSAARPVIIT